MRGDLASLRSVASFLPPGESVVGGIALPVSSGVCLGVCVRRQPLFLLAMWAPGQTKQWLFSPALLCEIPLFMPRWKDFVNISSPIQF